MPQIALNFSKTELRNLSQRADELGMTLQELIRSAVRQARLRNQSAGPANRPGQER